MMTSHAVEETWICMGGNRQFWGPFYERPGSFLGPKANFEIKTCSMVSSTFPSLQTGQFCFVDLYFHFIIFKIIETLILNVNPTNTKQLFMLKKLSGLLSRNGPLVMYDSKKGRLEGKTQCKLKINPLYRRQWH